MMDRMEKEPLIQEGRRLPDVADVDGLVSFMGRLTEEQESFYLDLLLASLVRLHPFIKSDDVKRMMSVFEWAGTVMEMPESETGGVDKLFCLIMPKCFPGRKSVPKEQNNNFIRTINPIWIL